MEIFKPIIDVFSFIFSLLSDIVSGINSAVLFVSKLFALIFNVISILPQPLYSTTYVFFTLYSTIFIYKIFRKG